MDIDFVAPLAGAWIEIKEIVRMVMYDAVAPLAGAWIEIKGIKDLPRRVPVAPLAGAWIEMFSKNRTYLPSQGRSPRGSVD